MSNQQHYVIYEKRRPFGFAAHPRVGAKDVIIKYPIRGSEEFHKFYLPLFTDPYGDFEPYDQPRRSTWLPLT